MQGKPKGARPAAKVGKAKSKASSPKKKTGALANCLRRLEKAGEVKLTNKKPREYDLAGSTK